MKNHKFALGTEVYLCHSPFSRISMGPYEVVRLMPHEFGEWSYRIREPAEQFDRHVPESAIEAHQPAAVM
ncbi:hypothetical protein [Xanthobacter versatilis]|uniref:hypothetical protein n=1 Tax=Xanthobacter autotrophicus (strain ATCC BAA-1158 / Py2) TaxID=78245 RepID=UPI003728D34C